MTPKEKAAELVKKFEEYAAYDDDNPRIVIFAAKQCALITVDELLYYSNSHGFVGLTEYLQEVKKEIEKL